MPRRFLPCLFLLAATAGCFAATAPAFTEFDLSRARGMLRLARDETIKYFYDPARVGHAFSAQCDQVDQALASARSNGEAQMMIAQVFLDIGDSHTRLAPPARQDTVNHHWKFHAVGPDLYISEVDRGSDAEKKGLHRGDKVLAIDGMAPTRGNRWIMQYLLYGLAPRAGMRLIVQAPGQEPRQIEVSGEVRRGTAVRDLQNAQDYYQLVEEAEQEDARRQSRLLDLPGDILVWQLRQFDPEKISSGLRRSGSAKTVILDLRGNPGGYVQSAEDMLNGLFADTFDAYTTHERAKTETTKVRGKGGFKGLLLVLIDNSSASASEIFARTVQMRQRGILLGDRTAGALSTARFHPLTLGTGDKFTYFGMNITLSRVVMADGSVIEGQGVGPDYQILATHAQLYRGEDPVLAKALTIAGRKTTPEEAGQLFPPLH